MVYREFTLADMAVLSTQIERNVQNGTLGVVIIRADAPRCDISGLLDDPGAASYIINVSVQEDAAADGPDRSRSS